MKINDNRLIDSKRTMQIVIDTWFHQSAKIKSAKLSMSLKTYIEGLIAEDIKDETATK